MFLSSEKAFAMKSPHNMARRLYFDRTGRRLISVFELLRNRPGRVTPQPSTKPRSVYENVIPRKSFTCKTTADPRLGRLAVALAAASRRSRPIQPVCGDQRREIRPAAPEQQRVR